MEWQRREVLGPSEILASNNGPTQCSSTGSRSLTIAEPEERRTGMEEASGGQANDDGLALCSSTRPGSLAPEAEPNMEESVT